MTSLQNTSVAETYRFIKEFVFSPSIGFDPYTQLEFSDSTKIRFDFDNNVIRLRLLDTGYYSTESNIWFRTYITNPKSLRKLLMIQIVGGKPEDTTYQVRLHNGTNHYYWDGDTWSIAGDDDWNDEATINANISTFTILPNRRFAVVVNLITTDKYNTPYIESIKVLMEIKIDYIEDILYRSLMYSMKNNIRVVGNFPLTAVLADTTSINLNDWKIDTAFDITDIDAVYNFTTDNELLYNLFSSYNPTTKIITLSDTINTGEIPFIIFKYAPKIVYTTQQDYFEVNKVPAIILNNLEIPTATAYSNIAQEGIVDKGTGNAVVIKEPWRATFQIRIHLISDKGVDHCRLISSLMKFFDNNRIIRSVGLDEYYRMQIIKELREITQSNDSDLITSWTELQIMDIRMPFISEDTHGIMKVNLTFKEPKSSHEDPVLGGSRIIFTTHVDDSPSQFEESFEITK